MAVLREIGISWEPGLRPGPCRGDDPDGRAFVQTARHVCGLYQAAVVPARLRNRAPVIRFRAFRHDRDDVFVAVHVDPTEVDQFVEVFVPEGVAALAPPVRTLLALDVVHGALLRLALARQWDVTVLDVARRSTLDASADVVDEEALRPAVHVVGRGATAPEQPPEICFVGGGPSNGVPRSYQRTLDNLLDQIAKEPAWLEWWSAADRAILEIFYWYDVDHCRVTARRGRNKLIAAVERPTVTMQRSADPVALARQDVDALVEAIRRRMTLPRPPALRT